MRARLAALALALAAFAFAKPASAANPLEKNFWLSGPLYSAEVPLCEDDGILARIQSRFSQKEREYWNSDLRIVGWEFIREQAFMPWHYAAIPRRFCIAKVHINDGTRSVTRSLKIPASSGPLGASSGALTATTATGPTTRRPRPPVRHGHTVRRRAPSDRARGRNFTAPSNFVLDMFR